MEDYAQLCITAPIGDVRTSADEYGQGSTRPTGRTSPRSSSASNARSPPLGWHSPDYGGTRRITRSLKSGRPGVSCLTRAGHRPVVWPHEIPDSGISHRNTGSSPCSGTEEGDISPVSVALEHAAGDFTTLGKNPLHGGSSPSDTKLVHAGTIPGIAGRHPGSGFRPCRAIKLPVRLLSSVFSGSWARSARGVSLRGR
jgi:hypothetical protein